MIFWWTVALGQVFFLSSLFSQSVLFQWGSILIYYVSYEQ
jgi:hypothetical protein